MTTSTLLHRHCHPKTELVLQKPLKKPENTKKGLLTRKKQKSTFTDTQHTQRKGPTLRYTVCACILTLSTSTCSSTWSFLETPVQNKKIFNQKLMRHMLPLLLLSRKVPSPGYESTIQEGKTGRSVVVARAKRQVQRKSAHCLLCGRYFGRINGMNGTGLRSILRYTFLLPFMSRYCHLPSPWLPKTVVTG